MTAYRWLSNWLATGTCWVAMLSRSCWMAAWLMVSVKTHTLGPNEATFASGQMDAAAAATWDGTAANPAPATSAAAARTGRHRQREVRPLVILLISFTFAPSAPLRAFPPRSLETTDYSITGIEAKA